MEQITSIKFSLEWKHFRIMFVLCFSGKIFSFAGHLTVYPFASYVVVSTTFAQLIPVYGSLYMVRKVGEDNFHLGGSLV